jgi:TPP-dependent pyruvate/acetoin dehydrogenase alpha subunit
MQGHSASDDASYVPAALLEAWKEKDPIDRLERVLLRDCVLTAEAKAAMEADIASAVRLAAAEAEANPPPGGETAGEGVYA